MNQEQTRIGHIDQIDRAIRAMIWQAHKQSQQTLIRPDITLTMPQMITLFAIHTFQVCSMSTLAETTQQSAGTLTGIVDRLIDDGLVERVRDPSDRRVVRVALTAAGQDRIQRVEHARRQEMARTLAHFSDMQLEQIEKLLSYLVDEFSHTSDLP